jgi:hypothetical protein
MLTMYEISENIRSYTHPLSTVSSLAAVTKGQNLFFGFYLWSNL